jgi:hypothetical protein
MVKENKEKYVNLSVRKMNQMISKYGPDAEYNPMNVGKYGCVAEAGPKFATQRQEAMRFLTAFVQGDPKSKQLLGDLILKASDFPYAEEAERRWRKILPPGMAEPKEGETPEPPLPPSPPMQVQILKGQVQMKTLELKEKQLQVEQIKLLKEIKDSDKEVRKIVLEMMSKILAPQHPADKALIDQAAAAMSPARGLPEGEQ